jgi:hypothetical protein
MVEEYVFTLFVLFRSPRNPMRHFEIAISERCQSLVSNAQTNSD